MGKYLILFLVFISCNTESPKEKKVSEKLYSNTIGDIGFSELLDDPNFTLCRPYYSSPQYYGLGGFRYEGEMSFIKEYFIQKYKAPKGQGQSGFFTVRFIVNCKGKTGRFRTYSTNTNLEEYTFDTKISEQLLNLTKELKGWKIGEYEGTALDYYQYLTFKIQDSEIKEITP